MSTPYQKGRAAEYKTIRELEKVGYTCTRSASSKGLWDVVGVNSSETRLIQVSSGREKRPCEIEPFELLAVSPGTVKELWSWPKGARKPLIRRLL